jgi:alpha-mannosidase
MIMNIKYVVLIIELIIGLISPVLLFSQPINQQEKFDLSKDKVLYLIGYAHMDSEWLWDYPTTIDPNIRNTMEENFYLFEKYPDYVFNFTGSRRYEMMKEYYPELYQKVVQYVKDGRWHISGSSVDEGEVNVSSSESLVRQVLYGNNYFRKEFGTESMDYMLPDCFGFLANTPSIWNHCGLIGFSTQKFAKIWNPAIDPPFNVGIWNGPDGKGVIAALNVAGYTSEVKTRLDKDSIWNARLDENIKHGYSFDYAYYGVGDQGGAPRENDVRHAEGSIRNKDSKFKVILSSSDQMYKDITPGIREKLPTYSGDLLLVEHSAGSLTSEVYMKRLNRKNEILAQSAEDLATVADWLGGAAYPFAKLNKSWKLLLGSQFHDILPGTSVPKAYEYAWNDEFIAANGFAEVLKNSVNVVSSQLNTHAKGRSVVVYNPVASDREDVVSVELEYSILPENVTIFDQTGKAVPSQIICKKDNKLKVIFRAKMPSVGLAVFDIRESGAKTAVKSTLAVSDRSLENEYYRVKITDNGDIQNIFDKKAKKEILAKPSGLDFQQEQPRNFPSWNMDWKDRQKPPIGNMNADAKISIVEQGPVRVSIEVKRKGMNSEISQIYSLAAGEAGKHLEMANKIDWQSKEVSLKAAFPLTVENENATYNLGVGTIQRGNNNEKKFEVPSKQWFDLTDKTGSYGVTILEDCRYGSDKPDNNTLRLTLMYTPKANAYVFQGTQDWGIHDFRYGIYGHIGDWRKAQSQWQSQFFNQPLLAFEVSKHDGSLGKSISLLKFSSPSVGLMAFKKMEQGDYYLVRVTELSGNDLQAQNVSFPGKVVDAFEVNGQEKKIGNANFKGGKLNFDLSHYTIRSFAVKLENPSKPISKPEQAIVELPYNSDAFSFDHNRADGAFERWSSFPAEMISSEIVSEDVRFKIGNTADEQNNAVTCKGQAIILPQGYSKLYFLASATEDVNENLLIDGTQIPFNVQHGHGYIGQFYNRKLTPDQITVTAIENPYMKKDNIAWFASHRHLSYPSINDAYQYSYIYKYEINIPQGAKTITLPNNQRIRVFAITAIKGTNGEVKALQPLFDDFQDSKPVLMRTDGKTASTN